MGSQRDWPGPAGDAACHGLDGDLVRPGGAVGLPCPGVFTGLPGVTLLAGVGVGVVVGGGADGGSVGVLGTSVLRSSPGAKVRAGPGVSAARTGVGVTCGLGLG
jgi:hypothetical protein